MAVITIPGMFLTGDHASRPAATAVGTGSLYSCSTHSLVYQSDGATWSTWATLGASTTVATDTIWDTAGDLAVGTGANTAAKLATGATSGHVLTSNGAGVAPSWQAAAGGAVATDAIWDAAGDLAVGTGANTAAKLSAGATSGHVLTSNGAGVAPSWQAGSGGGAPTGAKYVTTATDGTLSAEVVVPGMAGWADVRAGGGNDDEFDTTDTTDPLTGWTTIGTPTAHDTNSTALSHYYLRRTSSGASIHVAGIYKASPSLPFTVTAKIGDAVHSEGSARVALMVGEATPGAMTSIGLTGVSGSSGYNWNVAADAWTNPTTYGSSRIGVTNAPGIRYFRFVCASSTDVTSYASRDGQAWWLFGSASFNPGFTIASAGLIVNQPQSGVDVEAFFDWIRFT